MTPEVEKAVTEIKSAYPKHHIEVESVGDGGASVIINDVNIGDQYEPVITWIGFVIGFQYPRADVYPHYISHEIKRKDGSPLGEGFSGPIAWQNKNATQISRKSNRLNPSTDTALFKLAKVLEWLRSRK